MAKHSEFERQRRAAQAERVKEIEAAWHGSLPPKVAAEFEASVRAARARPQPARVDMAPGTLPNPPRPGHEPKPKKEETNPRRRR